MLKRRVTSTIAALAIATLSLASLSACASDDGAADGTIRVGVVGDLSGPAMDSFGGRNPQVDGINAAVEVINEDGGVNGNKIELVTCDTQSDPSRAPICAQEFISKKVFGVVGLSSVWSPTGIAATDKAGILNFTYPNSDEEVDAAHSFPIMGGGVNSYPAQAKHFTVTESKKNAAIFYIDLPLAANLAKTYEDALERFGATKVTKIAVPMTAADMAPYVTEAQEAGAEVIYGVAPSPTMVLAIKAADQFDYHPAWTLGDAAVEKSQILDPLGDLAEGVYGSASTVDWTDPADAETKQFLDAMEKYQPKAELFQNTATGFSTLMTLARALEDYEGKYSSKELSEHFSTVSGVEVFMGGGATLDAGTAPSEHPHDLNPAYNIVQWQGGKISYVANNVNGWVDQ